MSNERITGYLGKATASGREIIDTNEPQVTITNAHQHIHNEESYLATYSALKGDSESIDALISVPISAHEEPHLIITFESALASTIEVWYPTTKTDVPGNRITAINRVLGSSNASPVLLCHTPGGSQAGTATITRYVGSPTTPAQVDIGGGANTRGELLIPKGGSLYLKFTSRSANNALTLIFDWYE